MHPHKNPKLFLFVLAVLAVSAISFSIYQIYNSLYGPLKVQGDIKSFSQLKEESQIRSIEYVMSLQNQDTDQDGLSDYDEIYNYKTSPYLKDTDSDGIPDKAELESGADPLCHKDKDCTGQGLTPPSLPLQEFEKQIPEYPDLKQFLPEQDLESKQETPDFFSALSGDISASKLRSLLVESGFSQEQVDAFSDEELLETWSKILKGGAVNP